MNKNEVSAHFWENILIFHTLAIQDVYLSYMSLLIIKKNTINIPTSRVFSIRNYFLIQLKISYEFG